MALLVDRYRPVSQIFAPISASKGNGSPVRYQYYRIATPHGIDEARYVPVGGIEQYISIRGEDRDNPVILFLHGGPGDAANPWGCLAFRPWLKYFTVVQWDQRGAGRTLGKSGPEIAPTKR